MTPEVPVPSRKTQASWSIMDWNYRTFPGAVQPLLFGESVSISLLLVSSLNHNLNLNLLPATSSSALALI
jgi:hypothetical protein